MQLLKDEVSSESPNGYGLNFNVETGQITSITFNSMFNIPITIVEDAFEFQFIESSGDKSNETDDFLWALIETGVNGSFVIPEFSTESTSQIILNYESPNLLKGWFLKPIIYASQPELSFACFGAT